MEEKHIVVGILAHVDAGKTTLSEGILYTQKQLRQLGRVDHKDAFLDNNHLEKERGITIFSKQACFALGSFSVTLLDTPGHIDFSAEMERTLPLLDYALLVVNGANGVQAHTKTLWNLLKQYRVPVFIFVNKMDQPGTDRKKLAQELSGQLSSRIVDMTEVSLINDKLTGEEEALEAVAVCRDEVLEQYLETGDIAYQKVQDMITGRELFPCYFGSALKLTGVDTLLKGMGQYMKEPVYPSQFAARIYKIGRDEQGNRLTYLKVTGGELKVKDTLEFPQNTGEEGEIPKEKVNQIRIYSGAGYKAVNTACAGVVCAVTGLTKTYAGQGIGTEKASYVPALTPVLNYRILLPDEADAHRMYGMLKELEEEEPLLEFTWEEKKGHIHGKLMGEVQCEILKSIVKDRFGVEIAFGESSIVYKETITQAIEGVGHFEPLKHYAEVHLLLEPGAPGSGMQYETDVSEDRLSRNWQRLVMKHLKEKMHVGVLTGSELTDTKVTLIAGRAHQKHTEGGDFGQATYRAVRQGLKMAQAHHACRLLEPVYEFTLSIPAERVGRALNDIVTRHGRTQPPQINDDQAVIKGTVPVAAICDYAKEVMSYTHGTGQLVLSLKGYEPCHNEEEVIESIGYDSEQDMDNPTGSVFCAHGAGFLVNWYDVPEYMHIKTESRYEICNREKDLESFVPNKERASDYVTEEEIEEILKRTYGERKKYIAPQEERIFYGTGETGNETDKIVLKEHTPKTVSFEKKEKYLLVDGYNIIFAWEELNHLAQTDLHGARTKLMDIMCDYQAYKKMHLILVFDAYKVQGGCGEVFAYHNIHVVYTKEAETADQYIEKVTHEIGKKYDVTVATSDGLEQLIVLGNGAKRISARGLLEEVQETRQELREKYLSK